MKAQWHPTLICWAEIFHCYRLGVCKLDVASDLTVEPYTLISMPWTKTVVARWQFADSTSTGKDCCWWGQSTKWVVQPVYGQLLPAMLISQLDQINIREEVKQSSRDNEKVSTAATVCTFNAILFNLWHFEGFFPHFSYSWRTLWSLSSPFWPTCQPIGIQPTHSVIHILQHAVGMLVCNEIHTQKDAIVPSTTHYTGPDKPGVIFVTWHTWHSLCSPGWRHKGKSRSVLTTILIIY